MEDDGDMAKGETEQRRAQVPGDARALGKDVTSYDLDGRSEGEVRCTNCSGIYCGRRNIRVVNGRPLCICNLKLIGGK